MKWPTDVRPDGTSPPIAEVAAESAELMRQSTYLMKAAQHVDALGLKVAGFQAPLGDHRRGTTIPLLTTASTGQQSLVYTNCFKWDHAQVESLRSWAAIVFGDGASRRHITVIGAYDSALPAFMYGVSHFVRMPTAESEAAASDSTTSPGFFGSELAADCVSMLHLRKIVLDYTPDSLEVLDDVVRRTMKYRLVPGEKLETLLGCYVGEFVCRQLGGTWCDTSETTMAGTTSSRVVVRLHGDRLFDPIASAHTRLQYKPGSQFSVVFKGLISA